jgi:soluble cytochrome b562
MASLANSSNSSGRKRPAADSDSTASESVDVESLMATLRADMGVVLATSQSELKETLVDKMGKAMQTAQKIHDQRCEMLESDVSDVKDRQDNLEKMQTDMQEQVSNLATRLCSSESKPAPQALDDDEYFRDPRLHLIICQSQELITREAFFETMDEWINNLKLPESAYRIQGGEKGPTKNFYIEFVGSDALAARRAKKGLNSMQNVDKSWPEVFADTPSGGQSRLYFNPDKAPAQKCREATSKKLHKMLADDFKTRTFRVKRLEGTISVDWLPLAKVVPIGFSMAPRLEWVLSTVATLEDPTVGGSIDRTKYQTAINNNVTSSTPVQYCL